jgi:4-amino-4-deoxy-L-arabinose transferase-like glycosyltransferase
MVESAVESGGGLSRHGYALGLAAVALAYVVLALWLPPVEDELYYWSWSRHLQASYYDHPPMVAVLIRLSTVLFGDTPLGLRAAACACGLLTLHFIARLLPDRATLGLLVLTPVFSFGAVLITPDAPLWCCWSGYALWLTRRLEALAEPRHDDVGRPWWRPYDPGAWLAGGVILGLGVLSKYTMGLAVPCAFVALCGERRRWRAWLGGWLLHLGVAFAVASPILVYNLRLGFAPLRFQWEHAQSPDGFELKRFLEFFGLQLLLMGTLPFLTLPLVLARVRRLWADPRLRGCLCLSALPLLFFARQALRHQVEGNWPVVGYLTFWPVAAGLAAASARPVRALWLVRLGFTIPVGVTAVMATHLIAPLPIPKYQDRLTRMFAAYEASRAVADYVRALGTDRPVYAMTYQWTSYLRYQHLDAHQVPRYLRRSQFTIDDGDRWVAPEVLVLTEMLYPPEVLNGLERGEKLAEFPLVVRGQELCRYKLIRYGRPAGNLTARAPDGR